MPLTESADASDYSIVLPLHNEAEIVPFTFPQLLTMDASEIVILLDRCTDKTEQILKQIWNRAPKPKPKLTLITLQERSDWKNQVNFLYHLGIKAASSEYVLLTQADILMDFQVGRLMPNIAKDKVVSFSDVGHPHNTPYNTAITQLLRKFPRFGNFLGIEGFSGTLAFSKDVYEKAPFKGTTYHYDTHMHRVSKALGIYKFVVTNNYNLRSRLRFSFHFDPILWRLGVEKHRKGSSFIKVLAYSILRFLPVVMVGWLQSKLFSHRK